MTKRNKYILIIILFGFFSFLFFETKVPFTETSDARYSEIAYETLVYNHYLIPTQNRIIHITKPPLTYWLTALGFKIFGVNEFGGRFFSGICGILSAILVFFISLKLFKNEDIALLSGIIFETTPLIIGASRIVTTDIFLLTTMLFSIYYFLEFEENENNKSLYLFWMWLGISGFVKGPLGYLQVLPVVLIYLTITKQKEKIKKLFKPIPVLISLIIATWWFVYIFAKIPNSIDYLLGKQFASRLTSKGFGHPKSFYYYFEGLLYFAYPWIFGIIFSIKTVLNDLKNKNEFKFLAIMFLFPILFFSIPVSKLSLYILLSLAALSIMVSYVLLEKEKCSLFILSAIFEITIVVVALKKHLISFNFPFSLLVLFLIAFNLFIPFLKTNKIRSIFAGIKIISILLIILYTISLSPEKYLFTMKTTAKFINKLPEKPKKVYLVGFNSRSFILYTKIHPIETRFDKEFIYSDPETKKLLIHINELKKRWQIEKDSLIVVRNRDAEKYLKEFSGSKIIFKDNRFSVLSHRK
ncbi:4-amino-4-deoxy-L-arabinose transferase [Thermotomaculum hydrothermale]|uniref:4-amino-4-deoxy-L-arabinose transferase n=1 Tax=Thermotomaculum hydrothermale TaxID=981385 RepID=A0A7R6PQ27_9BACT|nr:glycosyltransferase family 39 protein [Thermotomaculum hydrothermale]BBB32276.1 4-amino-4-deoxy-L-arabinose transferase [Thermotomaculum hydrothermale]